MADVIDWNKIVGDKTVSKGGFIGDIMTLSAAHIQDAVDNGRLTNSEAGEVYAAMLPTAIQQGIEFGMTELLVEAQIETEISNKNLIDSKKLYFIKYLNQNGGIGKHKDGIDMSLVNIDLTTGELVFAGANNPIYIIRDSALVKEIDNEKIKIYSNNNSYLLYEFKPDKMPVSFCDNYKDFSEIKFKVRKGDIIYLFSDGFVDQFGGETKDGKIVWKKKT